MTLCFEYPHNLKTLASVIEYAKGYRDELNTLPSFFFSVCNAAVGRTRFEDPNGYIAAFTRETRWQPWAAASFAGGLPYRKYNLIVRFIMWMISRREGHPTDTSRNHDLTNWKDVSSFGDQIANELGIDAVDIAVSRV